VPDRRILLVEDNRSDEAIALRALDRIGLGDCVDVARDGQEALVRLLLDDATDDGVARGDGPPRVVFLDLKMPRVDGWEVLRRIRQNGHTRDLPVVVVSASDRPADVRRSYELGANSFLVKRFDAREPGRYLADAARYWLELNEAPPTRSTR
jgi:two-component system response regulator